MKLLPWSTLCDPGTHCHTCRSLKDGRGWRESAARAYAPPAEGFVETGEGCPKGLAMHDEHVNGPPVGLPLGRIPDDFDPEEERRRLQAGGCCGAPSRD